MIETKYEVQYTSPNAKTWKHINTFADKQEALTLLLDSRKLYPTCTWRVTKTTFEVLDD